MELDEVGKEVVLGKGAFGVVVKGTYRLQPVAIKRLTQQSPEQQEQFLREMAILRACRGSRHVVPFVGACLQPVRAAAVWRACTGMLHVHACGKCRHAVPICRHLPAASILSPLVCTHAPCMHAELVRCHSTLACGQPGGECLL